MTERTPSTQSPSENGALLRNAGTVERPSRNLNDANSRSSPFGQGMVRITFFSFRSNWMIVFGPMISSAQTQKRESVVVQPRVLSPAEYLLQDTTNSIRTSLPGEVSSSFLPSQDSSYARALAARVSAQSRFQYDAQQISIAMRTMQALQRPPSLWETINRNMAIPSAMLAPSPQEVAQYQINIARSTYVPGVLLFPMGSGNLQVGLNDIAKLFGMVEDVTPRIRYVIDETIEVTVVVYSPSAVAVATLFNGIQAPGAYELVWDGMTDANQPVGKGDYVAEVQLGNQRVMRKRIVWPPAPR